MAVVHTKVVEHLTEKDGSRRVDILYTTDQGDTLQRDNILLDASVDAVAFAAQLASNVETKLKEEEFKTGQTLCSQGVSPGALVFKYHTKAEALNRLLQESRNAEVGDVAKLTKTQSLIAKLSTALGV